MLYNIIFGFILPWVLVLYWIRKQPILFIVISPITAVISMTINTIGFYFNFWQFKPLIRTNETISAMPFDIGLYAVLGSLLVYSLSIRLLHPIITLLIFSLFTTLLEYMAFHFKFVTYGHGWNIGWTFISYTIAYLAVTVFWMLSKKYINIIQ